MTVNSSGNIEWNPDKIFVKFTKITFTAQYFIQISNNKIAQQIMDK